MERFYRQEFQTNGLYSFQVKVLESDLFIICDRDLSTMALNNLNRTRGEIQEHIERNPVFLHSLTPVKTVSDSKIIERMEHASDLFGVGPMATVAGAVAQCMAEELSPHCSHLIIENGGDICLKSEKPVTVSVYAGEDSPFGNRLRFRVKPEGNLMGICTSSGTIGHSLSLGNASAVVVLSDSAITADAGATAIANLIKTPADVEKVLKGEKGKGRLNGLIIVAGNTFGAWGNMEFVQG